MASVVQSNPHHRKIELQSPLDLTHLQTQLSTSARQKLDLHFPPSALQPRPATHITLGGGPSPPQPTNSNPTNPDDDQEETDPLRAHVQRLLTAFLHRTWTAAAPSISINGLDASAHLNDTTTSDAGAPPTQSRPQPQEPQPEREGVDFTYAPYDARLQGRLAELYGELEGLTAQVARLRREAPARGAAAWEGALTVAMEREDELHGDDDGAGENRNGQRKGKGKEEVGQEGLEMRAREALREGWAEDVKGAYEEAVAELARLSGYKVAELGDDGSSGGGGGGGGGGGLTGTVGKVQRARHVAEELE